MHAARQVETIRHRMRAERLQPARRGGREVQRNDELRRDTAVGSKRRLNEFAAAQLIFIAVEPQRGALGVHVGTPHVDTALLESLFRFVENLLRHLRIRCFGTDLQRKVGWIEIRQRIDEAEQDDCQDPEIAPH